MIKPLDSFRFYAFLSVYLYHTSMLSGGYLGVQAFFVLSGFLLTPILLKMKSTLSRKDYFLNFYGRRALRIFPLYYAYLIGLIITSFLFITYFGIGLNEYLKIINELPYAFSYTYNFYHVLSNFKTTPFLSHLWSLAVEEQFYLIWPIFIFFIPQNKINFYLLTIQLFCIFIRYIIFLIFFFHLSHHITKDPLLAIYVLPFSHFDAFAIGGLFALLKSRRWLILSWSMICITLTVGYLTQYIDTSTIKFTSFGYSPLMLGQWKCIWGYSLINITFATILGALKADMFHNNFFSQKTTQYLGKISYGLYIYHFPVLGLFWKFNYFGNTPLIIKNILMLIIIILISIASYELFEKKFLVFKNIWFPVRS
jgi:peptidoglycan/LPS O-acetylase OafA/YrhL